MPLRLETKHPDFGRMIHEAQEPRVIADASDGLIFTEGPIWNARNQSLTFSDIPGNAMYVVDELVQKLEDYRRGYFLDAIQPEEYEDFGPVVLFRNSFEEA